jgi:hypothetical protein
LGSPERYADAVLEIAAFDGPSPWQNHEARSIAKFGRRKFIAPATLPSAKGERVSWRVPESKPAFCLENFDANA